MAYLDVGSVLGSRVAQAVKRGEQALGVIGWFGVCVTAASMVSTTWHRGFPSAMSLLGDIIILAHWMAMLGTSIWLRKPSRWLAELGFSLGYHFALFFGVAALFAWLFLTDADEAAGIG